jgi:tetratricopeptide (TPR) repeat protein
MRNSIILLAVLLIGSVIPYQSRAMKDPALTADNDDIAGQWIRYGPSGPISLEFKSNGMVEGDFGMDNSIEIISAYIIENGIIRIEDKEGVACPEAGEYKMEINDYYLALDLVEDNCGGRVRATMGFWVRPGFEELISKLSSCIQGSGEAGTSTGISDPGVYLNRARMYMAVGKSSEAKQDLDQYIAHDSSNARVYVNRAGTRFPADLQGVIHDCNKALELDPESKNAFFLRGLAAYSLGDHKQACEDFYNAIELGFTVLKDAEREKCSEYWESYEKE